MKKLIDLNETDRKNIESKLGTLSDLEISREYSIGVGIIYRLRTKMNIPTSHHRESKINEHCFDVINHISAYWLGYLFADGCICATTGNRHIISISSIDEEIIKKYSNFIKFSGKIRKSIINNKGNYGISIDNISLYKKLKEYGMVDKKTAILNAPKINEKYYLSFLCGYFDGDGCISFNHSINSWKACLGFGSYDFYCWVQEILIKNNIIFSTEKNRKTKTEKSFYIVCMNGISGKYFLELCYKELPKEIPLSRKMEKYNQLCAITQLSNPRFQEWEFMLLEKYGIEKGIEEINKDIRNYGWIRSVESAKKIYNKRIQNNKKF